LHDLSTYAAKKSRRAARDLLSSYAARRPLAPTLTTRISSSGEIPQQPAWRSQAELLAYELYDPVGESQVYVLRFLIIKI